jgi:hypothetical protein
MKQIDSPARVIILNQLGNLPARRRARWAEALAQLALADSALALGLWAASIAHLRRAQELLAEEPGHDA